LRNLVFPGLILARRRAMTGHVVLMPFINTPVIRIFSSCVAGVS